MYVYEWNGNDLNENCLCKIPAARGTESKPKWQKMMYTKICPGMRKSFLNYPGLLQADGLDLMNTVFSLSLKGFLWCQNKLQDAQKGDLLNSYPAPEIHPTHSDFPTALFSLFLQQSQLMDQRKQVLAKRRAQYFLVSLQRQIPTLFILAFGRLLPSVGKKNGREENRFSSSRDTPLMLARKPRQWQMRKSCSFPRGF